MKPTLPDRSPTSRSVASMREYYSRVLAYIACGASIAAGTYTQYFSYGILWMVPYALLYPTWRTTSASASASTTRAR